MIFLLPYLVDVPMHRWPISNFAIIGLTVIAFLIQGTLPQEALVLLILDGWQPLGLLGHMWLHTDIFHLIGNMLFLWVFGNAVCAKVGNLAYPLLYVGFGLAAAAIHLIYDGLPAVGASGAINGIVGAFLILYPLNDIRCFFVIFLFVFIRFKQFSLSSLWIILMFLAFDVWGATRGVGGVAYFAHLGGFSAGLALIAAALVTRLLKMDIDEKSLLQVLGIRAAGTQREGWHNAEQAPERIAQPAQQTPPPGVAPPPRGPGTTLEPLAENDQRSARDRATVKPPGTPPGQPPTDAKPPSQDFVRLKCVCGKVLRVPRSLSGKQAKCPACSQTIRIPDIRPRLK